MPDKDLAEIYGTETKCINRAVKRNSKRFPDDFRFQLTKEEVGFLRFQNGTFQWLQGVKYLPWAYTREGDQHLSYQNKRFEIRRKNRCRTPHPKLKLPNSD
ncbi:ORF6N domain-containing protein [Desulfobacterales bacterium HSG2]|nr:ORF6N domain-containing protein [Desulfobacterales bacterium HSG2]